jgi:hypothetical protein
MQSERTAHKWLYMNSFRNDMITLKAPRKKYAAEKKINRLKAKMPAAGATQAYWLFNNLLCEINFIYQNQYSHVVWEIYEKSI